MWLWTELVRLVVPVSCPGCGRRDLSLCRECAKWWASPLRRVESRVPRLDDLSGAEPLPIWALADYAGSVRGQILAWKDRGREDLTRILAEALVTGIRAQPATFATSIAAVVPMPSSSKSQRARGRAHLAPLANRVAHAIAGNNQLNTQPKWLLKKPGHGDQVGQGLRARGATQITVQSCRARRLPKGARVLLLDDVVTTGATLATARHALQAAGYQPVGALVLAVTPAPGTR